ncbi:MAG TPA: hypothetical protein VHE81_12055 [Lacipirellulaceae bacterium]|nr:hypothetical protein [Lacipirellulaceae bacterium]
MITIAAMREELTMRLPVVELATWMLVLPCTLLVFAAGCDQSGSLDSPTAMQLRALSTVYLDFAAARGRGPQDEHQLLAYIKNVPQFLLAEAGIAPGATSRALISKRDGEPFVIYYGEHICLKKHSSQVIACEKKGKDGTRYVAFADGHVDCIDEAAAKALMHEHH